MSGHRIAAITRRLLQQFRRDRRTLALLFVAPIVILGLLGYLIRGSASAPAVGVANEDQSPLGAMVAAALARSSEISTSTVQASEGDAKLRDGSLVAYIVLPPDFSQQAQGGTIAPEVHLEGSQPGTTAPVLQALQQAAQPLATAIYAQADFIIQTDDLTPDQVTHQVLLAWLLEQIGLEAPDVMIITGDVFDSATPPASAERMWFELLAAARVLGTEIAGNCPSAVPQAAMPSSETQPSVSQRCGVSGRCSLKKAAAITSISVDPMVGGWPIRWTAATST